MLRQSQGPDKGIPADPVAQFDRACWWRDCALSSIDQSERKYRIVFTSESVTGIAAAVAVGVVGSNSVLPDFRLLGAADGFPAMPASQLVIEYRDGVDTGIADAMGRAIHESFREN